MTSDPPAIEPDTIKWLVRNLCMSADSVALGHTGTPAERTRAIVQRSIEAGIANGVLRITPVDEWPYYYVPDPPYFKETTS